MVVAASQHPPGVESHAQSIPPGVTPVQGARHAGPYRGPNPSHLDRQQQGNWPFFYMQPTQPYMPCQWPMPMPYVPYGGFPGLGRCLVRVWLVCFSVASLLHNFTWQKIWLSCLAHSGS